MKKLFKLTALAGLLFAASASFASDDVGLFFGFEVGQSSTNYIDDAFGDAGSSYGVDASADTSASAFRLNGGLMFNENVGAQISVVHFGTYKYRAEKGWRSIEGEMIATGVISDLVAHVPLSTDAVKLFGEVGLGITILDMDDADEIDSGGTFHIGAGIKFALNKTIDLQASIHRYFITAQNEDGQDKFAEISVGFIGAGLTFNF